MKEVGQPYYFDFFTFIMIVFSWVSFLVFSVEIILESENDLLSIFVIILGILVATYFLIRLLRNFCTIRVYDRKIAFHYIIKSDKVFDMEDIKGISFEFIELRNGIKGYFATLVFSNNEFSIQGGWQFFSFSHLLNSLLGRLTILKHSTKQPIPESQINNFLEELNYSFRHNYKRGIWVNLLVALLFIGLGYLTYHDEVISGWNFIQTLFYGLYFLYRSFNSFHESKGFKLLKE